MGKIGRVIAVLMVALFCVSIVPIQGIGIRAEAAVAESGVCGDNVTWELTNDGTLKISGKGDMDSYAEAAVGGYMGDFSNGEDHPWYNYRSKIKKIVISSGVTSVGAYAFFDCFNCTSLVIKSGVKTIGEGAFAYLPISSLSLPESVTTIGKYAFYSCSALQKVTFSDNVTVLDCGVFQYCDNLNAPVLPKKLTKINSSAFYGCSFDEIVVPSTVAYIGFNFAYVNTIWFLGAVPSFDHSEPPFTILNADYCYCQPEFYEEYKAVFEKWRAQCTLSDGSICAKIDRKSVTLSPAEPTCQLTVSEETGSVSSFKKKWWVQKSEVASVNQMGVVTASGHGETMLYAEITAGGYHSMASCKIYTKRNDLMVSLLPEKIKADFPVTCGTSSVPYGEVDACAYQPGKLAETNTNNTYYKQLLTLTKGLIADCSTDEQKARAIWKWVSENIEYGGAIGIGNHASQVYSVYLERKAHCEGFAKLTGFMLYLADIPSCLVAGGAHMWNIALLDGKWTMIDSTNREFNADYNDCDTIEWIGFGEDDFCFVIDSTEGVKLAGAGNHYIEEERTGYTSLKVPGYVDIIFGNAFFGCKNLKKIYLPKSIKEISIDAFKSCSSLTKVYYDGSEKQWNKIQIEKGNDNLTEAKIFFDPATVKPELTHSCIASSGKIKLEWNDTGAQSYEIYRSTGNTDNFELLKTTTSKSYTDSSAKCGQKYYYKVRGVFSNGKKGVFSAVKSRICDLAAPVVKISNVAASGSIKLTWKSVSGAVKYEIYRSTSEDGKYKLVKATTSKSYTDSSAKSGKKYYYKVKAIAENSSANSAASTVKYRTCDLAAPVVKLSKATSSGGVKLTWKGIDGAVKYEIYRSTGEDGKYKLVKATTTTSFTDKSVKKGKKYYYKVKAVAKKSAADSAYSTVKSSKVG